MKSTMSSAVILTALIAATVDFSEAESKAEIRPGERVGYEVGPRLRELALIVRREPGGKIHAT